MFNLILMIFYLGNQLCGRCLNLEEDPNDIKEDSDRLMKDISRLESMHSKEKEEWKDTMDKVIKKKDTNISTLENKNDKLLVEIGELQRKIEEIETQKETVLKEHKKMEEKIEKLGTMNEELKSEKCELSTQRDRLMKDIGRLESMHSNEKGKWKGTMDKVIKKKDMSISILENKNDKRLVEIRKLQRKIEEIETQKETVLKEHKKMEEKIEKLGTMNEELKSEKCELSTQRDRLMKDIGRLESMHSNEKGEWKGTMDKVIKKKDMSISILENKNDKLLVEIGKL